MFNPAKILRRGDWIEDEKNQKILAEIWGDIIDWQKRRGGENGWLVKQLRKYNCKKVLDAALGDGCDSIYLVKEGLDVTSNDVDEVFIQKALENAKRENVRLKIYNLDWRELTKEIPKESFDAVLYLGNSLTCLFGTDNQIVALRQFHAIIKEGGVLLIDERNYQYILDNRREILKGNFRYSGKYIYCGGNVHAKLTDIDDDKIKIGYFDDKTSKKAKAMVYPFKKGELRKLLEKAEFQKVEQYSDYQPGDNPEADFYQYVCQK